ncbi:hypothetical protein BpHYR1_009266 [Brachionus plicatilis]|uniref:Uncharacterized protein n=1 Tax=Brachionus plicatilis TaxID=10195 RepID=A0A3M7Q840_BRAPC|nr:hypothetical protein BpHYR1_009266 [Brachionus plicatilis]
MYIHLNKTIFIIHFSLAKKWLETQPDSDALKNLFGLNGPSAAKMSHIYLCFFTINNSMGNLYKNFKKFELKYFSLQLYFSHSIKTKNLKLWLEKNN